MSASNTWRSIQLAIAVSAILGSSTAFASSYSITMGGTAVAGEGIVSSVAGAITTDFNGSLTNPAGYSGGGVENGSTSGLYASPPNDTSNYFSVGPSTSSPATISLGQLSSYFGYYGGSPDSYNSIEFWRDDQELFSISGDQLAAAASIAADGNWATGAYWNIWATDASSYFNTIKLVSGTNAFETDNHAVLAAVPLPASLPLLLSGLGVLGFVIRRKNT